MITFPSSSMTSSDGIVTTNEAEDDPGARVNTKSDPSMAVPESLRVMVREEVVGPVREMVIVTKRAFPLTVGLPIEMVTVGVGGGTSLMVSDADEGDPRSYSAPSTIPISTVSGDSTIASFRGVTVKEAVDDPALMVIDVPTREVE